MVPPLLLVKSQPVYAFFAARRLPAARRCFREPRIGALGARPGVLTEKTEWSETSSGFLSEAQATHGVGAWNGDGCWVKMVEMFGRYEKFQVPLILDGFWGYD